MFFLSLSILDGRKPVMYEFWYGYVKVKHGKNSRIGYMDRDSFIVQVKTEEGYKDIAEDVETRFDTSFFELYRALPKEKN